ncbi:MAG: family 43 glycosylhydrolase [Bryobacteraceae bacterium]|nr:family 43 glycosylhydrolase [Bryobacteraceae bacterium]
MKMAASRVVSRRGLLLGALGAARAEEPDLSRYETPYKLGRLALAADPDPTAFDHRAVDCPFVFRYGGEFRMTYLGFDGTGYQTGLAASSDLATWRKLGCILRRDPSSPITRYNVALNWIVRDSELRSPGELKKVKGRFLGVFHAYPNPGYEEGPAVIGLCRSGDLMKWDLGDICLRPEDGADWERGGLYKPCLVEHDGVYYLFYNAKTRTFPKSEGGGWREQTGVATSTDLKAWKRFEGNPIVRNGPAGSPDERFASDPCVMLDGKRWVLFYFGLDAKGVARDLLAYGDDPFHMKKADRILIDVGPPGSIDSTYAHKPSVIEHDGALYHFYCAVSGRGPSEVRGISLARSRPWG